MKNNKSKICSIFCLNAFVLLISFNSFAAPAIYDNTWGANIEGEIDGLLNDDWNNFILDQQQTIDITKAQADAGTALTNANTANTTANKAQADAGTALTNASNANTTANKAQADSGTALTNASNANTTANKAQADAGTALTNASNANTTANKAQADAGTALTNASNANTTANKAQADANNAYSVGVYAKSQALLAEQHAIDDENSIRNVQSRVDKNTNVLANHEKRITDLENKENSNFNNLKNDIDNNRRRSSSGISSVAAMANIPQVIEGQRFSLGVGMGHFDSENSVALGASVKVNEHIIAKASVSEGSYGGAAFGVGASLGF